jgi:UDP-N-acetyl-D-glucosamine dehydrogenase
MKVGIIGMGYVGLPLAVAFAEAGDEVYGVEVDPVRVASLERGESYVEDITSERLQAVLDLFHPTTRYADLAKVEAVIIAVPTPLTRNREPDLTALEDSAARLGEVLQDGQLVVLESTTYPGTTREKLVPILEEHSNLVAGSGFNVAFSPERVDPGRTDYTLKNTPKVVGGLTPACLDRALWLYGDVCDNLVPVSAPEPAELAKLLENVFRNVNIALVNQLALLCERMGLDVWEVIDAAATKPFGFMRFTPGPGVGGHCIPVDPYYLSWRAREFDFVDRFVELAGDINFAMPRHVVDLVAEALNDRGRALRGAKVGVLGVAFKPNVRDARNSPSANVLAGLAARGAEVSYHDPHVSRFTDEDGATRDSEGLEALLKGSDVVVALVAHKAIDWATVYGTADLVVDTVDTSRRVEVRPRQVLRLGAGWSAGTLPP